MTPGKIQNALMTDPAGGMTVRGYQRLEEDAGHLFDHPDPLNR